MTSGVVKADKKRLLDVRGSGVEIQSFVKATARLTDYKCMLDPVALGVKGISSEHGQDIRLALLTPKGQNPVWANQFTYGINGRRIFSKMSVPKSVPLPITIASFNPRQVGSMDLGGIGMNIIPGSSDDETHKITITNATNALYMICTFIEYYNEDAISNCFWPISGRHVVVTSTGTIWVGWTMKNGAKNSVYYSYSADGGRTWTSPALIDSTYAGNQIAANCIVDMNDTIHWMWSQFGADGDTNNAIMYRSVSRLGVWGAVETVSISPNPSGYQEVDPSIQIKPDNVTPAVAWCEAGASGWANIYFRERDPTTGWGAIQAVTSTALNNDYRGPAFDYDRSSKVHMLASYGSRLAATPSDIVYINNVSGWSVPLVINTEHPGTTIGANNIVVDMNSILHATYLFAYDDAFDLIYKQLKPGGSWSAAETVDTDVKQFNSKQADAAGNIHFLYGKNVDGQYVGCYRVRNCG